MTEEIIIDGINVAGCVQLVEEPFYPCGLGGECKDWENCYYKQLKRLEQENKELKEKIKDKPLQCILYNDKQNKCALFTKTVAYHCALKEIRGKIESLNKDICNNCGWYNTDNCQPNGYVRHGLIEIKNKINEVLDNVESK